MACAHSCVILLLLVAAVALSLDIASAKQVPGVRSVVVRGAYPLRRRFTARGCSSFGHSCFGGHGKRSDEEFAPPDYQADPDLTDSRQPDRLQLDRQVDIVPLLRQWLQLQSYRRAAGPGAESSPN